MPLFDDPPLHDFPDRAIRRLLETPANLRDLLMEVAPAIATLLDFDHVELQDRGFLLEDWRGRESDLLFRIPFRSPTARVPVLVCILLEHQSAPDPRMPLRVLVHAALYWEREWKAWEDRHYAGQPLRLTPILPIVFACEILTLQTPLGGYGSGVGLAFDAGEGDGRGSIQRVDRDARETGYVLQTVMGAGAKAKEEYRFVFSSARKGRIGLRRVGKVLVFLTAEDPGGALQESHRLPFTDWTIRAVRFFADTGGSSTALDVRATEVRIRAEEITGGVPQKEEPRPVGWWVGGALGGVGLLYGGWRLRRRRCED